MKNYYHILGLESNASKDEIKKAYRTYATKFHPDKQNGDKFFEERFKEILEAYEILSDDSKRANYDSKRTSDYSKGTSANNRQSYSKAESDINKEREQKERREKQDREEKARQEREERARLEREERARQERARLENAKKIREENIKARRNKIYYTSKDLSVNGMYIYKDGKSFLIDNYDSVVLRKDDSSSFVFVGIVLIIIGILTIAFFIGIFLLILGIFGLFHKEYFIVLVNEYGDTPLIKGNKQKMKRIANKINKAFEAKNKYAT